MSPADSPPVDGVITARIATLKNPFQLVFASEVLDPGLLGPGELICETIVSVISPGTELAAYKGAPPLRPGVVYPRVVGYCNVARVLHRGPGTTQVEVGDRVLTYSSHRSHFRIATSDVLAVLPPIIRNEDAACAYLYHLGYSAVLRADVRLGSSVVVIGLGVLGLGAVAMASLAGARVYSISSHARSRECAHAMGADECFDRSQIEQLMAAMGERGAQVVITTSNGWDDWRIATECAGMQGTIAVLGFPGRGAPDVPLNPLDSAHFYAKQLRIIACGPLPEHSESQGFLPFNVRDNVSRILRWITDGALLPSQLLAGEFPADDLEMAYRQLMRSDGLPGTYLLRWSM